MSKKNKPLRIGLPEEPQWILPYAEKTEHKKRDRFLDPPQS